MGARRGGAGAERAHLHRAGLAGTATIPVGHDNGHGEPAGAATPGTPGVDAEALLATWEQGCADPPARRAVRLLDLAWPLPSGASWVDAAVGRRDGLLLTLQEELFGRRLEGVADCPACRERLEVGLHTDDIRMAEPVRARGLHIACAGYEIEFRLPTSADLLDFVERGPDAEPDAEPGSLLARCIDAARRGGAGVDPSDLPEPVTHAVVQAMADGDPQADVQLALQCPACGHAWSTPFDIVTYLWDEVDDWARRVLREVHSLASAYGWSERDVLAMSARRRRLYLEMAAAWS